ncbi:hypothetical protein NEAUS05_0533 [Nematocida ausubeli]|nr:hypothetical protein NEAUS07_0507 [Nematocida ausubeli]KAI5134187.1 hypothetical protein NEAUS06_0965 [Nematocida ausubeli]KAI5147214.1 hypothetical protein NEAUS05_0533 [Nematocida ausubeli]
MSCVCLLGIARIKASTSLLKKQLLEDIQCLQAIGLENVGIIRMKLCSGNELISALIDTECIIWIVVVYKRSARYHCDLTQFMRSIRQIINCLRLARELNKSYDKNYA